MEPKLKVKTWRDFQDAVSALSLSDKFTLVGTTKGTVHLLDLDGNLVRMLTSHSTSISHIHHCGEFVISASIDGNVIIHHLYSESIEQVTFKGPIYTVALEPDYGKSRRFVSGGSVLSLTSKGWLGLSSSVLLSGHGDVLELHWNTSALLCLTRTGLHCLDANSFQKFGLVALTANVKCCVTWTSSTRFLLSNDSFIQIIDIATLDSQKRNLNVLYQFSIDSIVCGLAPFSQSILVLGYLKNFDQKDSLCNLLLYCITESGDIESVDTIDIPETNNYIPKDCSLVWHDSHYFVVFPTHVTVAQPRDDADHATWLLEHHRYEDALHVIENPSDDSITTKIFLLVSKSYLESQLSLGNYHEQASKCTKLLCGDQESWVYFTKLYLNAGKIEHLLNYIPVSNPQLPIAVYDLILNHLILSEPRLLGRAIELWPTELYTCEKITGDLERLLVRESLNQDIERALFIIYSKLENHSKAFRLGLHLFEPFILDMVVKHSLFSVIEQECYQLCVYEYAMIERMAIIPQPPNSMMVINKENTTLQVQKTRALVGSKGVQLLADYTDCISSAVVFKLLYAKSSLFCFAYLDAIWLKNENLCTEFHSQMVDLYAEHDPSRLLGFLRASFSYNVEKAYRVCEVRDLVPEMMYLLGKMGNNSKALYLMIDRLNDVKMAIDFAIEQNDPSLWTAFLDISKTRPEFILALLECSRLNPLEIIQTIPNSLAIPKLKQALEKIYLQNKMQLSLVHRYESILLTDTWDSFTFLYKMKTKGKYLQTVICEICNFGMKDNEATLLFQCNHGFHQHCLDPGASLAEVEMLENSIHASLQSVYTGKPFRPLYKRGAFYGQYQCQICHKSNHV